MARQNEQGHPTEGFGRRVIFFGEVDKAHVQGGVLLPRQYLPSSYYEHHVNRRSSGSEPTLFLRQNVLAFALVTQATRDEFEEYFAGVSHEESATIIATLSPIFLLVKHLDRCIFLMLRYPTSPQHSDNDIMELLRGCSILLRRPNPSRARPADHRALPPFGSPTHRSPSLLRS